MVDKIAKVDERCKRCADVSKWCGLTGNIFLTLFKGYIAILTGSLALMADAMHSAADILVSTVTITSITLAKRPPNKAHPYGYGKIEFFGGVFTGTVLLVGASFIVVSAICHLLNCVPKPPPHFVALGAAAISIVVNEALYRLMICGARRVNSASLEAEALDNRSDAFSSIPVFFGILGTQFGFTSLDPLAALFVGIMVGRIAFGLLSKNINGLMDTPLPSNEIKHIREMVVATAGVKDIDYLRTRRMGRLYMADMQILVNPKTTVKKSDAIVAEVRSTLRREIKNLEDITIVCKADVEKQEEQTH